MIIQTPDVDWLFNTVDVSRYIATVRLPKNCLDFERRAIRLFHYRLVLTVNHLKYEDKVTIQLEQDILKKYKPIREAFMAGNTHFRARANIDLCLTRRVKLLVGVALAQMVEGAVALGHMETARPENVVHQISHETATSLLVDPLSSGDFEEQLKQAFFALWLTFPQPLTPYDTHFKRVALQYM